MKTEHLRRDQRFLKGNEKIIIIRFNLNFARRRNLYDLISRKFYSSSLTNGIWRWFTILLKRTVFSSYVLPQFCWLYSLFPLITDRQRSLLNHFYFSCLKRCFNCLGINDFLFAFVFDEPSRLMIGATSTGINFSFHYAIRLMVNWSSNNPPLMFSDSLGLIGSFLLWDWEFLKDSLTIFRYSKDAWDGSLPTLIVLLWYGWGSSSQFFSVNVSLPLLFTVDIFFSLSLLISVLCMSYFFPFL